MAADARRRVTGLGGAQARADPAACRRPCRGSSSHSLLWAVTYSSLWLRGEGAPGLVRGPPLLRVILAQSLLWASDRPDPSAAGSRFLCPFGFLCSRLVNKIFTPR